MKRCNNALPIVQAWGFCVTLLVLAANVNAEETNHVVSRPAIAMSNVWFVRAGANGDGTSPDSPIGSTERLESVSGENDIIVVLTSETPLRDGLLLKKGQRLIGLSEPDKKPVITNTNSDRHDGHGIVLANDNRISNIRVDSTLAGGIIGTSVSGVLIENVEVAHANTSRSSGNSWIPELGDMPHGGIVLEMARSDVPAKNRVARCVIRNVTGVGIGILAKDGAKSRLQIDGVKVIDGTGIGIGDSGIAAFAYGPKSESALEVTDSVIKGRLGRNDRNLIVLAGAHATANARIDRCRLGVVGQDGVLGAVCPTPACVRLQINDSVVEKAGQCNVEGTIVNFPSFDSDKADATKIAIAVADTVIRDAGAVDGAAREEACNIFLGGSALAADQPLAKGSYWLTVDRSKIENSGGFGIVVGGSLWPEQEGLAPDESAFDVTLRRNAIMGNGIAGVLLDVPNAKVDARQNEWDVSRGTATKRFDVRAPAKPSQLNTSDPIVAPH